MIDTMIGLEIPPTVQDYVRIVPTRSVIALVTETTCIKAPTLRECETRRETETIVLPVIETDKESRIAGITMTEHLPKKNLHELATGQNMSARLERNTITTASQKSLSGRNLVIGSIGKRRESTNATENVTDVIVTVIVNVIVTESTIGSHTLPGLQQAVHRTDIPVLIGLTMYLTTAAVATAMFLRERLKLERTTGIISPSSLFQSPLNHEGTAMVSRILLQLLQTRCYRSHVLFKIKNTIF